MTLKIGEKAPDFICATSSQNSIGLSDLSNQKTVLYFYPKDDTPGCTKQAIAFTDLKDDFAAANTVVIGVSKDTVAKHEKFTAKHNLDVLLISDHDGDLCEKYGTWVEKSMYGKKYMGIERSTFLINTDGTIAKIWRKVKVAGHVEDVLKAAQDL